MSVKVLNPPGHLNVGGLSGGNWTGFSILKIFASHPKGLNWRSHSDERLLLSSRWNNQSSCLHLTLLLYNVEVSPCSDGKFSCSISLVESPVDQSFCLHLAHTRAWGVANGQTMNIEVDQSTFGANNPVNWQTGRHQICSLETQDSHKRKNESYVTGIIVHRLETPTVQDFNWISLLYEEVVWWLVSCTCVFAGSSTALCCAANGFFLFSIWLFVCTRLKAVLQS